MLLDWLQYLADTEEHLGVTIDNVDVNLKVEANEFDGEVVYGQRKKSAGNIFWLIN